MYSTDYMAASGKLRYPLTNDYLFRALVQRNNRVLIALICALLHIGEDAIASAKVKNPIILGDDVGDESMFPEVRITYRIRFRGESGKFPEHLLLDASSILRVIQSEKNWNPFHEREWKAFFQASTWEELKQISSGNRSLREAAMTAYELSRDNDILFFCRKYMH